MHIVELSDSEDEVQHGGAHGFESSDEAEYVVDEQADDEDEDEEEAANENVVDEQAEDGEVPNENVLDEQPDYVSSDEYNTDDEDEERDPTEEDEIYTSTSRQCVNSSNRWATEFTFRTAEDDNRIEDIGELVNIVLRKLIRDAQRNALEQGYQGGWIGVAWGSEVMEGSFIIPYGHQDHNNPRKLLTAFEQFDQSAKENDLYGQIIRVQVTIVNTPPAGSARKSTKSLVNFGEQKDKKDALLLIENKDSLCLFKAVVVAIAYDEAPRKLGCKKFKRLLADDVDQTRLARELMGRCGIPTDLPEYRVDQLASVQDYLNRHQPERYRLLVFSADNGEEDKPVFNGGVNADKELVLWHENGLFDAMKTVERLFKPKKNNKYCPACECFYHGDVRHTRYCPIRCPMCLRMGRGYPQRCRSNVVAQHRQCPDCKHTYQTQACYDEHLKAACRVFHRCLQCGQSYRVDDKKRDKHQCGFTRCRTCHQYAPKRHLCHVPVKLPTKDAEYRIVVFDIESRITDERTASGAALHIANVVCARVTCTRCMENDRWENHDYAECEICGRSKCMVFTEWGHEGRPMAYFLEWLLRGLPRPEKWKTYVYSHNGASYDMQFSLHGLYERGGRAPKIVNNGLKLMQIELRGTKNTGHVVFRDSCSLFPMKLDDIPETFSVTDKVPRKPYFPYKANSVEYYEKDMVGLPPQDAYLPNAMSVKKRQHFEKVWYPAEAARRKYVRFDIKKEAVEYCNNDTLELLYGVVHNRKLVNQVAEFGVFSSGMTISSLAVRLFKTKFMKEKSMAVVPTNGYDRQSRQSTKALKTLKYLAEAHGIEIQHRNSNGGEKAIGAYLVDGFITADQLLSPDFKKCARSKCYCKKISVSYAASIPVTRASTTESSSRSMGARGTGAKPGCFVNDVLCPNGKTADENWSRTMKRRRDLVEIHELFVYSIQECVIDGWLQRFPEIREAFGEFFDDGPIDPREAMFGGRVGPLRMHWKRQRTGPGAKYRARFLDINSLFPFLGHPTTVAHDDELCRRVRAGAHWTKPADCPIKGLLKVRVVPPQDLIIPVMPMKDDNRLLFPLCRTCAVQSRKVSPFLPPGCAHDDTQRSFVTTTTHVELVKGLEHGYRVVDLIGYYDWPADSQWSTDLFRSYIYAVGKLKEEASGWKDKGIDVNDPDAREKMVAYMEQYLEEQGIEINIDNVEKNDGLRYVIKLFLNSLWGRFAMRMDRVRAEVVTKQSRFIELLSTKSLQVVDITIINEKAARVTYRYRKQFEREDENSNLVVASFTTAYGRLELFEYLRKTGRLPSSSASACNSLGSRLWRRWRIR